MLAYWEDIGEPEFPVTGSINQDIREAVGYVAANLPPPGPPTAGNIVLTPDMEILEIVGGHGTDEWAYEAILNHMEENQ